MANNSAVAKDYSIPRRTMKNWETAAKSQLVRNFYLLDDMTFDGSGSTGVSLERSEQFSCAFVLRRDQNNNRADANLTVVVYLRRSIDSPSDEAAYMATPTATVLTGVNGKSVSMGNTVTLSYTSADPKPAVRRGGWILDSTLDAKNPQGFYYRVTDVGEPRLVGDNYAIDLQLESSLRTAGEMLDASGNVVVLKTIYDGTATQTALTGSRLIVVPDRVYEVFEKGPMDVNSPSRVN
jgi:hypothetical protein